MTKSAPILLSLLGQENSIQLNQLSAQDWQQLIDLSLKQEVDALSVDGYHKCLDSGIEESLNETDVDSTGSPTILLESEELEDLKLKWLGSVLKAEEDYRSFTEAISSLAKTFAENGLKMMVLKGYGLSQDYPIPAHRSLGDIDIFLSDGNIPLSGPNPAAAKGDEILRSLGYTVDEYNSHHNQINFKGHTIENHYFVLDNDKFISNIKSEQRLRELLQWNRTIEVRGATVYLPSPTFGAMHLLRHSGGDFCSTGTNLRQVMDWGLFIKAHHDEIDFPELIRSAKEFRFIRWMGCLDAICVDYLGMDAGLFPVIESDKALVQRIVDDIFHPEFQGEIPPMKHLVSYGLAKTRRMLVNRWKYPLVYEEELLRSFLTLGWNRLKIGANHTC